MTREQAKEIMESIIDLGESQKQDMGAERISLLALEKQIPQKPDLEGDGYDDKGNIILDTWICPCCGSSFECDYDDYDYCPNCGQAIDWSDYNDA